MVRGEEQQRKKIPRASRASESGNDKYIASRVHTSNSLRLVHGDAHLARNARSNYGVRSRKRASGRKNGIYYN